MYATIILSEEQLVVKKLFSIHFFICGTLETIALHMYTILFRSTSFRSSSLSWPNISNRIDKGE